MKLRPDQFLCLCALLLGLVGLGRWWSLPDHAGAHSQPLSSVNFKGAELPRANELPAAWPEPEAQSAGREWIFEVFTPPIVYFDELTQRFTVIPPLPPAELARFGVDLLSIERLPYRLQYAGHHGVKGAYVVEIKDLASGRYYRGRPGTTFPEGGFALREFGAESILVQPEKANRTPYVERSVRLVIDDFVLGESVTLSREALILPDPVVVLEADDGQRSAALHVGEKWDTGKGLYLVAAIDAEANSVTIARLGFDGLIETEEIFTLVGSATESEM